MRSAQKKPFTNAAPKRRAKGKRGAQWRGGWTIILIDQAPLRRKASQECRQAMARLERVRADWARFEKEDRPAFERWRALILGPLLTELREINAAIHQKEELVEEVEAEMLFGNWPSYEAAYRAVRRRREQPPPPPRGPAPEGNGAAGPFGSDGEEPKQDSQFEEELLFEDFLQTFLGMNPDRLSESEYQRMFAEFKKNVLGGGPRRSREEHGTARAVPPGDQPARLKELYRILVRRLHPDTRADSDPNVSALWHEVQQAYGDGNVERLEMLLAFTDMQQESSGEHTTVGQMRAVLREIRRSLNALLRTLAGAKRELAWNFAATTDRAHMERKLRKQMARDLDIRRRHLAELEEFIASWAAPKRSRGRSRRSKIQAEMEFPF